MPIEIKELYIKINVDEGASKNTSSGEVSQDTAAIIATCIEEVMEKLKEQNER